MKNMCLMCVMYKIKNFNRIRVYFDMQRMNTFFSYV